MVVEALSGGRPLTPTVIAPEDAPPPDGVGVGAMAVVTVEVVRQASRNKPKLRDWTTLTLVDR